VEGLSEKKESTNLQISGQADPGGRYKWRRGNLMHLFRGENVRNLEKKEFRRGGPSA